jgi:hypothetical protein
MKEINYKHLTCSHHSHTIKATEGEFACEHYRLNWQNPTKPCQHNPRNPANCEVDDEISEDRLKKPEAASPSISNASMNNEHPPAQDIPQNSYLTDRFIECPRLKNKLIHAIIGLGGIQIQCSEYNENDREEGSYMFPCFKSSRFSLFYSNKECIIRKTLESQLKRNQK